MAKLTTMTDVGKITDPNIFMRFASNVLTELQSIINGKIEFDVNIASQTKTVFFPTANVDLRVDHSLGATLINYIVVNKSAACDIYNGANSSVSQVVLRSTVAGVTVSLALYKGG